MKAWGHEGWGALSLIFRDVLAGHGVCHIVLRHADPMILAHCMEEAEQHGALNGLHPILVRRGGVSVANASRPCRLESRKACFSDYMRPIIQLIE